MSNIYLLFFINNATFIRFLRLKFTNNRGAKSNFVTEDKQIFNKKTLPTSK